MRVVGQEIVADNEVKLSNNVPSAVRKYAELYKEWESIGAELEIIKEAVRAEAGLTDTVRNAQWVLEDGTTVSAVRTDNLKDFDPKKENELRMMLGDEVESVFELSPKLSMKPGMAQCVLDVFAKAGVDIKSCFKVTRKIVPVANFLSVASDRAKSIVRYSDAIKVKA